MPRCRSFLIHSLAVLCLSLAAAPSTADEVTGDPLDTSFHLDDASLPDPVRSPGGTSPGLNAEDLCTTPPEEFSATPAAPLCDEVFAEHGISPDHRFQYRCGFLVPPTIGGSDTRKNIWLQPVNEATLKQAADTEARKRVCAQTMTLAEAQKLLAGDWVHAYRKFFRSNDKLLPIAKVERAPASFDAPPLPVPPGASPRAYLDNGGLDDGGGYGDGGGTPGDAGGGAPDDRRRRRHPLLRDGDRGGNRRASNSSDPRAANERAGMRPKDGQPSGVRPNDIRPTGVRPNDVRPTDVRSNDVRPNDVRPNDVRPNDVRPSRSGLGDARLPPRDRRFDGFDGRPDPMAREPGRQPRSGFADDGRRTGSASEYGRPGPQPEYRGDPNRSARSWPARPPSAYPSRAGARGPQRGGMLRHAGGHGMMRGRRR